jgi:hypothetical protein
MDEEREDFSRRLADAMRAEGYEPRPSVLFKLFNSRYRGASVSFQSVWRWLNARAIPEQDKLQVLAKIFGTGPDFLRYGIPVTRKVAEPKIAWPVDLKPLDREAVDAYLALPASQRKVVREMIAAFTAAARPSKS